MTVNRKQGSLQKDNDAPEAEVFECLSAEQVRALRQRHPPISPWRIVGMQLALGGLVVLVVGLVTQSAGAAKSAAYGVLTVVVPAGLFSWGLQSRVFSLDAATAGLGFFVWESVKIALSVAMLLAANWVLAGLNWLALLLGLVVALKVYWVAPWLRRR